MPAIRVLVADDDADFRGALAEVLEADRRFSVVGKAACGDEAIALARELRPDVVLLDVRMPGGGPEAARSLTTGGAPYPTVVAVSAQTGASGVVDMLRAGAVGYLAKGRLGAQLPDLVARAAGGEVVLAVPGAVEALRQMLQPMSQPAPVA
ncbi:response regulator [Nocardioides sp. MAHUQ-72]|uniref:response regulator n=1 Tax=unclassified Nocardioides TaxID=2615069 RepID=UPI00361D3B78